MAWTLEQLAALEEAVASGALEVKYADRTVKYQTTSDLLRVLTMVRRELGVTDNCERRRFASFSKGLE